MSVVEDNDVFPRLADCECPNPQAASVYSPALMMAEPMAREFRLPGRMRQGPGQPRSPGLRASFRRLRARIVASCAEVGAQLVRTTARPEPGRRSCRGRLAVR